MALIQLDGLKTSENVMRLAFVVYLLLYISEKFSAGVQRETPVIGILKVISQFAIAIIFAFVVYELGPNITSQERKLPSHLLILAPIIVYVLQEYTDTTLLAGSAKENENARNWVNSLYISFMLALCLVLNWYFYDADRGFNSFLVSGLGIVLYFAYTIYANVSANSGNSLKSFELTEKAMDFPKTLTFFATMLYFTVLSMKNIFVLDNAKKFTSKLYACAFAIPIIAGSYAIGTSISDTIFSNKRLMVTKLLNIIKSIDGGWTYYDICSQQLNTLINNIISAKSSILTPSANDVEAFLNIDDQNVLDRFGLEDTIPLNLFQKLQSYLQTRNGSLDLKRFLGYYKNTDPLASGSLLFNNTGVWSLLTLGSTAFVYAIAAVKTKHINVLSTYPILGLGALVGILIYLGYTCRLISHSSAARNEVYCEQYGLHGDECDNSNTQFQQANFQLVNQIGTIKAGSGAINVDGIEIHRIANGRNMKTLYNIMRNYPGQTPVTESIDLMMAAYNNLKSMAIEIHLQPIANASSIKIYSAAADPISSKLDVTDISLQDLLDVLVDDNSFMQSLGGYPYVPDTSKTFISGDGNAYFSVTSDPSTKNDVIMINYANKGQTFRQSIMDLFRVREVVKEMIYDFANIDSNLNLTMNPRLLRNLYSSGEWDVNASNSPYIDAMKTSFKAILSSKLSLNLTSDRFAQLTSPRSDWPTMKAFQTGGQYDVISNLPKLTSEDLLVVKDLLMHAISMDPNSVYDTTVDAYLNELLWVTKLELLNDTSTVMDEVDYVENTLFTRLNITTVVFVVVFGYLLFKALGLSRSSDSYFTDYFQSAALGSKMSVQHNSLYLVVLFICLIYAVANLTDLYSLEKTSLSNVIFTNTSIWGGKKTTIPLVISICVLLMSFPMYFPSSEKREHILFVTFLMICMMCSPLIYFLKGGAKNNAALVARKVNGVAVVVIFAYVSLLLISKDSPWLAKKSWSKTGIYLLAGSICLTCVSAPMMYLDIYQPDISASEFDDRIKKVNIGIYASIGIYAALYLMVYTKMQRKKLFANPIPLL